MSSAESCAVDGDLSWLIGVRPRADPQSFARELAISGRAGVRGFVVKRGQVESCGVPRSQTVSRCSPSTHEAMGDTPGRPCPSPHRPVEPT